MIGRGSPASALSGFFLWLSLSSRRSCDQMEGVGRQNWARGHIPIFRKIHLYAFLVKSTHGHTKKKPTQPFFRNLAFFGLPLQRAYPGPTLDLPWSAGDLPWSGHCPIKAPNPGLARENTYPGATLDLPWSRCLIRGARTSTPPFAPLLSSPNSRPLLLPTLHTGKQKKVPRCKT